MKFTIFRTSLLLTLALLVLPAISAAQTPFALTNMGQRIDPDDARMVARGSWGMAVSDSTNPGFKNLAGLTALRQVALKFTGYGDYVSSQADLGERDSHRTLSPDIRVALPIIKGKLVFSSGFEVVRSTQYKTFMDQTWEAWDDTLTGNQQFIREGSLWSVPMGLSYKVLPWLSVGGTVGLVNGTIRESVVTEFITPHNGRVPYPAPLYGPNGRVQEDEYSGTAVTWSMLADLSDRISVGASWRQAHDLDVNRKVSLGGVGQRFNDDWVYHLPDEYRLGVDLRVTGRWHLGGDYQLMKFTDYHGRDDWKSDLEQEYTYSLGLERSSRQERHGGTNNLPLRLGYQYRQWGYQVGGNHVQERFFSLGTGFPFRNQMGMLDLAFSYGTIGNLADNGHESKVWRFTMSFTGLEKWW